ncbi:MAG: alpha/beta fold hydrolase [Anaerolineae bacterium]
MTYVNHNGVQIHYVVEGSGEPILFLHGIAGTVDSWGGISAVLKDNFQCIRMDARGHGRSGKLPSVEDYKYERMASDVVAVLDDLGIEKVNYVGYSMGGLIGSAMTKYFPGRLKTLMIGGAEPKGMSQTEQAVIKVMKNSFQIGFDSGPQEALNNLEKTFGSQTLERKALFLKTEKDGFQAFISALTAFETYSSDFSAEHKALQIPKLIYVGDADEILSDFAQNGESDYPESEVVIMPNMRHTEGYQPNVGPLIRSFLKCHIDS